MLMVNEPSIVKSVEKPPRNSCGDRVAMQSTQVQSLFAEIPCLAPRRSVQRTDRRRGRACVQESLRDGLGGHRLKARRQHLLERPVPKLDEGEEPGFPEEIDGPNQRLTRARRENDIGCGGDALVPQLTPGSATRRHIACHSIWH